MELINKQTQQDVEDEKRRRASLKQSAKELAQVLANTDGIRRLRLIPDDKWQEAADAERLANES